MAWCVRKQDNYFKRTVDLGYAFKMRSNLVLRCLRNRELVNPDGAMCFTQLDQQVFKVMNVPLDAKLQSSQIGLSLHHDDLRHGELDRSRQWRKKLQLLVRS